MVTVLCDRVPLFDAILKVSVTEELTHKHTTVDLPGAKWGVSSVVGRIMWWVGLPTAASGAQRTKGELPSLYRNKQLPVSLFHDSWREA